MARHKVHYSPVASLDPEIGAASACGARQRALLPLLFSSFWPDVTCRRCRRHAPEVPRSPLQQLRRWMADIFLSAGARLHGGER